METRALAAGEIPLSLSPIRGALERRAIAAWTAGQNPTLASLVAGGVPVVTGENRPHGDVPHGDHTDVAARTRQAVTA